MQPTFLPWSGYFHLMAEVDTFVFLDDVQLAKPSWQTRNRILFRGSPHFLTVPTQGSRNQFIHQTRLATEPFREKHLAFLRHAYGRHPFGQDAIELLEASYSGAALELLAPLNERFIVLAARMLKISPRFVRASSLGASGKKSDHLLRILQTLGSVEYLSPRGSLGYIEEEGILSASGIAVSYQEFTPEPYSQWGASEFVSHLSILDVIANLGPEEAAQYVRGLAPTRPGSPSVPGHSPEKRGIEPGGAARGLHSL